MAITVGHGAQSTRSSYGINVDKMSLMFLTTNDISKAGASPPDTASSLLLAQTASSSKHIGGSSPETSWTPLTIPSSSAPSKDISIQWTFSPVPPATKTPRVWRRGRNYNEHEAFLMLHSQLVDRATWTATTSYINTYFGGRVRARHALQSKYYRVRNRLPFCPTRGLGVRVTQARREDDAREFYELARTKLEELTRQLAAKTAKARALLAAQRFQSWLEALVAAHEKRCSGARPVAAVVGP
ncbi:hypothetical protein B0A49_02839 [Cryomyces minteri]|uniref:Uncharacterized protein n=1 Tax=Cryomyces minteri TaxID=331657 RepID=A0A4U0XE18_9PEZI|nr:hypothetical protein B0A49_02839 [Cryomyces minteri]